jgi:hypothetical protein
MPVMSASFANFFAGLSDYVDFFADFAQFD